MKSLLVFARALEFLIPLAHTGLATPAVTKTTRIPFKGTLQSNESYNTIFPTMYVTATGSGEATLLGQITVNYQTKVNLSDLSQSGSVSFAGIYGDSLLAKGVGHAIEDRTPGMFRVVEIYTITGGTGRFARASGTLTLKRRVSVKAGRASGSFEGYIVLPANSWGMISREML
jgi:hypothetical protein